jgi:hypothetical protein
VRRLWQRAALRRRLHLRRDVVSQWLLQWQHLRALRESDAANVWEWGRLPRVHLDRWMRHDRREMRARKHPLRFLEGVHERGFRRHGSGRQRMPTDGRCQGLPSWSSFIAYLSSSTQSAAVRIQNGRGGFDPTASRSPTLPKNLVTATFIARRWSTKRVK